MKDVMLEKTILKILQRVECGVREKTLMNETEIAVDRPYITTDEFTDALVGLEDRGLVENRQNLIGERVWQITEVGKAALKGV